MLQAFSDHVSAHLGKHHQHGLILACSGGVDSMVLLDLLLRTGFRPALAHMNFQLRGDESDEDQGFVRVFARSHDLVFHTAHRNTSKFAELNGLSIQMAARELRYTWFEELMEIHGYDLLLTAHHQDDSLETFMINLGRGAGIKGLLGVPGLRNKLYRPLLPFSKAQIMEYATERQLKWREDSSNAHTDYLRNALRHEVIPSWKATDQQLLGGFSSAVTHLSQVNTIMEDYLELLRNQLFATDGSDVRIDLAALRKVPNYHLLLHYLFSPFGFRMDSGLLELLESQSGKWIASPSYRLLKDRDQLLLSPLHESTTDTYVWSSPDKPFQGPVGLQLFAAEGVEECAPDTIVIDRDKIEFPLQVRRWQEGDRFVPFGMQGSKKLSKYFKDEKLSLVDKERVWLLCTKDRIVWVIGHRMDDRFKVGPNTRQIARIQYFTPGI